MESGCPLKTKDDVSYATLKQRASRVQGNLYATREIFFGVVRHDTVLYAASFELSRICSPLRPSQRLAGERPELFSQREGGL
jgi:hypothetical protein